jgi:anti-sigma regulatory factor (Ser/Thr protein kinase)
MSRLHFQPIKEQASQILEDILKSPEISSCNKDVARKLKLACEEIVVNVTSYAYPEGSDGFLDVYIRKDDRIVIRFEDGGVPFNPLEHENPDTTLSWDERPIGGLGIFLVRSMMDDVRYTYENQKNVLTIEKKYE